MRCRCLAVVRRRHLSRCGARAAAIGASGPIAHFLRGPTGDRRPGACIYTIFMANIYDDTVRWREQKRLFSRFSAARLGFFFPPCIHLMAIFYAYFDRRESKSFRFISELYLWPNIFLYFCFSFSETSVSPPSAVRKKKNINCQTVKWTTSRLVEN